MQLFAEDQTHSLDPVQRVAASLIAVLVLLTFVGANAQALLWQSSDWLVGAVLPAVVVDLTNNERSDLAAPPLVRSAMLDAAAKQKAEHMAANGYFAHFAPDGTSPWSFFDQAGYVYAYAGENLAIHFTDSSEIVDAWMDSPTHRENIANSNFSEIGVGTAKGTFDGYETVFVVQFFGAPAVASTPRQDLEPVVEVIDVPPVSLSESDPSDVLSDLRSELESLQVQADALTALTTDEPGTDLIPQSPEVLAAIPVSNSKQNTIDGMSEEILAEPAVITEVTKAAEEIEVQQEVVVVRTELATSSGLAIANIVETARFSDVQPPGAKIASVITRPNLVVDVMYSMLISAILVLLSVALFGEARRLHYMQVAYSLLLIGGVGGLWYVHTVLTSGAVIL